jgi:hypothetical protein
MLPFHLTPVLVSVIAVVFVVLIAVAVWVALRDSDDGGS